MPASRKLGFGVCDIILKREAITSDAHPCRPTAPAGRAKIKTQERPQIWKEAPMVDMKTILTHNAKCSVRPIGNGLVIVGPHDSETHSIEDIGAFIWQQMDGYKDLEDILNDILNEYVVAASTAAEDLQTFVSQLMEAGLVVPVNQPMPST